MADNNTTSLLSRVWANNNEKQVTMLEQYVNKWISAPQRNYGLFDLDVRELPAATESSSAWVVGIVQKVATRHNYVVERYSHHLCGNVCLSIEFRNGRRLEVLL